MELALLNIIERILESTPSPEILWRRYPTEAPSLLLQLMQHRALQMPGGKRYQQSSKTTRTMITMMRHPLQTRELSFRLLLQQDLEAHETS